MKGEENTERDRTSLLIERITDRIEDSLETEPNFNARVAYVAHMDAQSVPIRIKQPVWIHETRNA